MWTSESIQTITIDILWISLQRHIKREYKLLYIRGWLKAKGLIDSNEPALSQVTVWPSYTVWTLKLLSAHDNSDLIAHRVSGLIAPPSAAINGGNVLMPCDTLLKEADTAGWNTTHFFFLFFDRNAFDRPIASVTYDTLHCGKSLSPTRQNP